MNKLILACLVITFSISNAFAGKWETTDSTVYYRLDSKGSMLAVNYRQDIPVIMYSTPVKMLSNSLAFAEADPNDRPSEIIINNQRLKAGARFAGTDPCKDQSCRDFRYRNNPKVDAIYVVVVISEKANQWAYNVLKNNESIVVKANGTVFNIDASNFKDMDSKHSVAF